MELPDKVAIRTRLLHDRTELAINETAAHDRAPVQLDQTSVGRLSRVDAMRSQAMALATEQRRIASIRRINQALARLDAETYGACFVCGEDISPKRLALDPAVPTCASGVGQ